MFPAVRWGSTVDRDAAAGVEWLLRAARQDQPDAILLLSIVYANRAEVRNTAEAERWLRRGMELGLADAETKLNELLAGKTVGTSFTVSNGYNFGSRLME